MPKEVARKCISREKHKPIGYHVETQVFPYIMLLPQGRRAVMF